MPELPEVEALAQFLRDHAVGAVVGRVDVAALSVLKTFDPPITSLQGRNVTGADRFGKHLALDCDGLWLIAHLSRGGWLRWIDNPGSAPPKPGKGPLAVRVHFFTPDGETPAFDLTEAGTKKRLAVWVVTDPLLVPGIARLGPDALEVTRPQFGEILAGTTSPDQDGARGPVAAGRNRNAYSDEILHAAGCPRSRRRRSWRPTRWTGCTTRCARSCPTPSNVRWGRRRPGSRARSAPG